MPDQVNGAMPQTSRHGLVLNQEYRQGDGREAGNAHGARRWTAIQNAAVALDLRHCNAAHAKPEPPEGAGNDGIMLARPSETLPASEKFAMILSVL